MGCDGSLLAKTSPVRILTSLGISFASSAAKRAFTMLCAFHNHIDAPSVRWMKSPNPVAGLSMSDKKCVRHSSHGKKCRTHPSMA